MKLGPITQVKTSKLKPNDANRRFFKTESGQYYNKLAEDIMKRGILVPLVAKKDGTLLAGHNRHHVALALGIETVPVQFIHEKITPEMEIEYIIKDNLLRRHLSPAERKGLYMQLYKDFDDRILIKNNPQMGIDARKIADETGLNPKTVNYDIVRLRKEKQKEVNKNIAVQVVNEKAVKCLKKAVVMALNIAMIDNIQTIEEFLQIIKFAAVKMSSLMEMRQKESDK